MFRENYYFSPTLTNLSPVLDKFTCFLHTLRVLRFPSTLTMMHLCITQCTNTIVLDAPVYWFFFFSVIINLLVILIYCFILFLFCINLFFWFFNCLISFFIASEFLDTLSISSSQTFLNERTRAEIYSLFPSSSIVRQSFGELSVFFQNAARLMKYFPNYG